MRRENGVWKRGIRAINGSSPSRAWEKEWEEDVHFVWWWETGFTFSSREWKSSSFTCVGFSPGPLSFFVQNPFPHFFSLWASMHTWGQTTRYKPEWLMNAANEGLMNRFIPSPRGNSLKFHFLRRYEEERGVIDYAVAFQHVHHLRCDVRAINFVPHILPRDALGQREVARWNTVRAKQATR